MNDPQKAADHEADAGKNPISEYGIQYREDQNDEAGQDKLVFIAEFHSIPPFE